jgi:hypothetical protein
MDIPKATEWGPRVFERGDLSGLPVPSQGRSSCLIYSVSEQTQETPEFTNITHFWGLRGSELSLAIWIEAYFGLIILSAVDIIDYQHIVHFGVYRTQTSLYNVACSALSHDAPVDINQ